MLDRSFASKLALSKGRQMLDSPAPDQVDDDATMDSGKEEAKGDDVTRSPVLVSSTLEPTDARLLVDATMDLGKEEAKGDDVTRSPVPVSSIPKPMDARLLALVKTDASHDLPASRRFLDNGTGMHANVERDCLVDVCEPESAQGLAESAGEASTTLTNTASKVPPSDSTTSQQIEALQHSMSTMLETNQMLRESIIAMEKSNQARMELLNTKMEAFISSTSQRLVSIEKIGEQSLERIEQMSQSAAVSLVDQQSSDERSG